MFYKWETLGLQNIILSLMPIKNHRASYITSISHTSAAPLHSAAPSVSWEIDITYANAVVSTVTKKYTEFMIVYRLLWNTMCENAKETIILALGKVHLYHRFSLKNRR